MTAIHTPTAAASAPAPYDVKREDRKHHEHTDPYFESDSTAGKDRNFFNIAFAQIEETNVPKILVSQLGGPQVEKTVSNLNDFGKAFNFDPVLNLATQATDQSILSTLDQAGQTDLIGQLIGALPAEVINTGFEQFTVPAGIENYDMLPTTLTPLSEDTALGLPPIQPLKALRGQITLPPTPPAQTSGTAAAAANASDQASPALIATGLTPDQITQLTAAQSEESVEQIDSLDVTLISVLPVLTQASAAVTSGDPSDTIKRFKANHGQIGQDGQISSSDLKALKDSINQLVPLDNAKAGNGQPNGQPTGTLDMAAQNAGIELPFSALIEEGLFGEQDLTEFNKRNTETTSNRDLPFINGRPGATAQSVIGSTNEPNANAAQHAKNQEAATTQLVNSSTGMVPWDSLDEIGALGISPESLSLGQILHNTAHTSPTLMHSHAATPHQATQAIAAKLTQYANQKGEQELKIQLDPPELGRVKIVMLVGKDGGIQAQLSFDKPETFLMMQRDSSQLEKSLAEAGIDMGESSLEFSLSSDNSGDDTGDSHDKNDQFSRGSGNADGDMADAQDIEITTTKMDWYKDNSGNIRLDMQA